MKNTRTLLTWTSIVLASGIGFAQPTVGVDTVTATPANPAEFTLRAPSTVTVQSGRTSTVRVTVARPEGAEGTVALSVEGEDVGSGVGRITGTFGGPQGTTLSLNVHEDVPVGPHVLVVRAENGEVKRAVSITVNVERWLLVDDDRSTNNWPANNPNAADSAADRLTREALTAAGKTFEVKVVPYSGSGQDKDEPNGPTARDLERYSGVIWYTGHTTVHPITNADRAQLASYLNLAHRKLILFSPGFVRDASSNGATLAPPGPTARALLTDLAGIEKVAFPGVSGTTTVLTGDSGTAASGLRVNVTSSVRGFLQPGPGGTALLREGSNVVAAGRSNVGASGSSKVVVGAFSLNHVVPTDLPALLGKVTSF